MHDVSNENNQKETNILVNGASSRNISVTGDMAKSKKVEFNRKQSTYNSFAKIPLDKRTALIKQLTESK